MDSKAYPNPAANDITIYFNLQKSTNVVVKIFNTIGQEVKHEVFGVMTEGYNKVHITDLGLDNGVYIYSIFTNDGIESRQFVVQK